MIDVVEVAYVKVEDLENIASLSPKCVEQDC